jgi:RimJ/RimL family protein N-acetyltransferase
MDPRSYFARDRTKDGTEIVIRAIRADDSTAVLEAFKAMDRQAIYRRFFSPKKELTDAELRNLTEVDFSNVIALVATIESDGKEELIAGGRFALDSPGRAELAFLTGEGYRGQGLASVLLKHLATIAKELGVRQFEADVLAENQPMLAVFRRSGLSLQQRAEGSTVHLTLSLNASPEQH